MGKDSLVWDHAQAGKVLLSACASCAAICHPPLPMCPSCQSTERVSREASARATLVSWLVSTHPGDPSAAARIVIVVRLAEAVNFVSNLIGAPIEALHEGMPLELCFAPSGDQVLSMFRPAGRAT